MPVAAASLLSWLTALSALLAVLGAPWALNLPWLVYVFKPLTTVLVIVYAWRRGAGESRVRHWFLLGLALSLSGDIALLWPTQGFLPGLVAFMLAHLSYIVAFSLRVRFASRLLPFAIYALVSLGILSLLWSGVPQPLRIPVTAYVVCLAAMAAQASVVWRATGATQERTRRGIGALGGALFVSSDTLLAIDRFAHPLLGASLWILATYWLAQWCIASSLRPVLQAQSSPGLAELRADPRARDRA
jgi:uncharacterized membrane protein YhhN